MLSVDENLLSAVPLCDLEACEGVADRRAHQYRTVSGEARTRAGIPRCPQKVEANWPGLRHVNMIKTGERTYCIIAKWSDMDALANARSQMIATLDSFRDTLEDIGGGQGVTDLVAGPVVLALK